MSALLLQALGVVCPSCDLFNPPASQKCSDCGTSLGNSAQAPAPSPAARPAPAAAPRPAPVARPGATPSPALTPVPVSAPPSLTPEPRTDAAYPPGMRPVARPRPAAPAPPQVASPQAPSHAVVTAPSGVSVPIPASELLKKPAAAPSRFGLSVLSGHSAGHRFRLGGGGCMVGRSKGAILFPEDVFVSAHHASFILREGKLFVRDETSLSGVYVTLSGGTEPLPRGGLFCAGQRLFRYAGALPAPPQPAPGRPATYGAPVPQSQSLYALEEVIVGGRSGRTVVTFGPLLTIGQQHCDLSYPGDQGLAHRHCELSPAQQGAVLRDLSGGLGTYVRVTPGIERALSPGDRVRIGTQVLQVEALG